jgi:cell division transport system permease protein
VTSLDFVSRDEALRRMEQRYPEFTQGLTSNPLPASLEVTPRSPDDLEAIAATVGPQVAGVDEVTYGKTKADRIREISRIVEIVFLAASVILLAAATILIANTIRLSIFARRREIEGMKLVGATNWFVRGPFMLEGLSCGFLGSVAAVVLLFIGREVALPRVLPDVGANDVRAWSFEVIALILVGVGLALGDAGSGFTIRRFLRV